MQPGEPEFLDRDTDLAVALAEEEAATCPSCGLLKDLCRSKDYQFAFVAVEEQCHATYALAAHRAAVDKDRDQATKTAIQTHPRFRAQVEPDLLAGLDLPEIADEVEHGSRDSEAG